MSILQILILAVVQGAAELLPISSSAHVIVAEKLMHLDPSSPEMTLLLVMLHTGTMFACIFYFWKSWKAHYFSSLGAIWDISKLVIAATACTGIVGLAIKYLIEKFALRNVPHAEVELLFGNLFLIASALAAVGILIIYAGYYEKKSNPASPLTLSSSIWIGLIQGICLPFRGFSRSGATISTGLLSGVDKIKAEEFSFALAVVITPPVIIHSVLRLLKAHAANVLNTTDLMALFYPSLLGMLFSFVSGILALKLLSNFLDKNRWHYFGLYCLLASCIIFILHYCGF
ncbi:MAG: undecaprenyl-diphosphate phosphatase [Smithella sp.]